MKTRWIPGLCVGALLALPGVASAALVLQIGQNAGSVDDFHFGPGWGQPGQVQYLDLIFTETGTPATEDLSTYDIGVLLTRPMGVTRGVRIVQPTNLAERQALARANDPAAHPYVFEAASVTVVPLESTEDATARIQLNFDNLGDLADIRPGMSAGRIPFVIDADLPAGMYTFRLDPLNTTFAGFSESILVNIDDQGRITYVPEPSALAGVAALGLLALRRPAGRRARGV